MLNIRINLTINLKKTFAVFSTLVLVLMQSITPAHAVTVKSPVVSEKPITVSLTYLKVTTTVSEAKKSLASSEVKYFDAEALAFLTMYSQGESIKSWKCLRSLWQKESHFNPKAKNMSSGAYGIAQFMPSTWGNYKVTKTAEARLQIKYGLRYIQKRYGSTNDLSGTCNAWRFHQKNNWY